MFEGLKGENDTDIRANVINIGSAIGIKVFNCEIEQVLCMPRRDNQNKKPSPVLITLSRTLLRDSFLRKKSDLMKCTGMEEIFVNADESIEVRRAKSFLRKASFNAKRLGETVEFRHNRITINGTVYTMDDVSDIPEKYLIPKEKMNDAAQAMELPVSDGAKNPDMLPKEGLVRRGEKIKITSKGLLSIIALLGAQCYLNLNFTLYCHFFLI